MNKQAARRVVLSWGGVAFCCFSGGIGAGLLGTALTAAAWMLGAQLHPWIHGLGTALLIVTIPLLIFSGYCLDWEERGSKTTRTRETQNADQR